MKATTRSRQNCGPEVRSRLRPVPAWGESAAASLRHLKHEASSLSLLCPNRQKHTEEPAGHGKRQPH